MRSFYFKQIEKLTVLFISKETPDDKAWGGYIDHLRSLKGGGDLPNTLVVTDGGSPNRAQRQDLNSFIKDDPMKAAVLTDKVLPRMTIKALSLINPSIRGFKPEDLNLALDYLNIPEARYQEVDETVRALRGLLQTSINR